MTVGLRAHHQGCACTSINNGVWFWGWGRKRVGEGDWNRRCGGAQDEAPPAPSVACWGLAESVLEEMGGLGRAWWGLRGLDLITGRWTQSQAEQIGAGRKCSLVRGQWPRLRGGGSGGVWRTKQHQYPGTGHLPGLREREDWCLPSTNTPNARAGVGLRYG